MISRVTRRLNDIDPSLIFLAVAILIGGTIRLYGVLQSNFPINDGGLFYTMIRDLMANGYRLPVTTSYNHLDLPFAYPPLFLYLGGFLSGLTSWGLLNIIRILPAVFTVLSIPAFYLLAGALLKDKFQVVIATFIFTFIPASFDWLVMGGGLTRSPAFFFALLSLFFIYRLYTQDRKLDILWVTLFSSLTILSHPETALHTAASALVFFLFFGRNKNGFLKSLLVAGLILVVTAPWWGTVIAHNGIAPFSAAGKTGVYNVAGILQILTSNITHEIGLQIIASLALIGLFWQIAERKYFVPVWAVVIFFSEPRSAPLFLTPCLAILAASALTGILQWLNRLSAPTQAGNTEPEPLSGKLSQGFFILLSVLWIVSSMGTNFALLNSTTLANSDQNAFEWVKNNTGSQGKFLVLTGDSPLNDPVSEWFPSLTGRTSVATVQGHEWDSNISYEQVLSQSVNVQNCLGQAIQCVESWAVSSQTVFDYIYIHNPVLQPVNQTGASTTTALGDLFVSQGYAKLVYQNAAVSIYAVK
jgi:hypothetical protein